MSNTHREKQPKGQDKDKNDRLKAALKSNLSRRKEQARARQGQAKKES